MLPKSQFAALAVSHIKGNSRMLQLQRKQSDFHMSDEELLCSLQGEMSYWYGTGCMFKSGLVAKTISLFRVPHIHGSTSGDFR